MRRGRVRSSILMVMAAFLMTVSPATVQAVDTSDTRLLASPAITEGRIAFVYADDVWVAGADGTGRDGSLHTRGRSAVLNLHLTASTSPSQRAMTATLTSMSCRSREASNLTSGVIYSCGRNPASPAPWAKCLLRNELRRRPDCNPRNPGRAINIAAPARHPRAVPPQIRFLD